MTGHAEVAQVTFDPEIISYKELLGIFFAIHDPTTLSRQGADVGAQYRQEYFARNPSQPYCQAVVAPKAAKFKRNFLPKLESASV